MKKLLAVSLFLVSLSWATVSSASSIIRGTSNYGLGTQTNVSGFPLANLGNGFENEVVCTTQTQTCPQDPSTTMGGDFDLFVVTPVVASGDTVTVDVANFDPISDDFGFFVCDLGAGCPTSSGGFCDGLPCPTSPSTCLPANGAGPNISETLDGNNIDFSFVVPSVCAGDTLGLFFNETGPAYAVSASDVPAGVPTVPEPDSLALLAFGLLGLLPLRRLFR